VDSAWIAFSSELFMIKELVFLHSLGSDYCWSGNCSNSIKLHHRGY
jgi:hypothetical protein